MVFRQIVVDGGLKTVAWQRHQSPLSERARNVVDDPRAAITLGDVAIGPAQSMNCNVSPGQIHGIAGLRNADTAILVAQSW
jgi:hypothetical protein